MENKRVTFDVYDTQIHKGIALLLLLGMHTFVRSNYDLYVWHFAVDGKPLLNWLMQNSKVCVSIFVILSGYGLNESFKRRNTNVSWKNTWIFSVKHLLKLMINFWVIFIGFTVVGTITGKIRFSDIWGGGYKRHSELCYRFNGNARFCNRFLENTNA